MSNPDHLVVLLSIFDRKYPANKRLQTVVADSLGESALVGSQLGMYRSQRANGGCR